MPRSISSARSQSRAKGTISRSQNSRAEERISSCSEVSVKSMPEKTRGRRTGPASFAIGVRSALRAGIDEAADGVPGSVVELDQRLLGDREVVLGGVRLHDHL